MDIAVADAYGDRDDLGDRGHVFQSSIWSAHTVENPEFERRLMLVSKRSISGKVEIHQLVGCAPPFGEFGH